MATGVPLAHSPPHPMPIKKRIPIGCTQSLPFAMPLGGRRPLSPTARALGGIYERLCGRLYRSIIIIWHATTGPGWAPVCGGSEEGPNGPCQVDSVKENSPCVDKPKWPTIDEGNRFHVENRESQAINNGCAP